MERLEKSRKILSQDTVLTGGAFTVASGALATQPGWHSSPLAPVAQVAHSHLWGCAARPPMIKLVTLTRTQERPRLTPPAGCPLLPPRVDRLPAGPSLLEELRELVRLRGPGRLGVGRWPSGGKLAVRRRFSGRVLVLPTARGGERLWCAQRHTVSQAPTRPAPCLHTSPKPRKPGAGTHADPDKADGQPGAVGSPPHQDKDTE